jgi:hypothetical protein
MMVLNYIGLAVGLSIASILLSVAYRVWRYRPERKSHDQTYRPY